MFRRFLVGLLAVLATGCSGGDPAPSSSTTSPRASSPPSAPDWFVDRAAESGLDFVHVNGMSGRFYMPEIIGSGVALFDYDNDGDLDVYMVQGSGLGAQGSGLSRREGAAAEVPGREGSGDRLYRNDLTINTDGTRVLHFTDVTAQSKIVSRGYGMGVATGDFNNDGWMDLYLTKFDAPNQLLRNNGDGTFTDVSKQSGTNEQSWSVSASFVDLNRDGWLDLYVGNYLRYRLQDTAPCFSASGSPDYCTPAAYQPLPDRLFVNRKDGTFIDASVTAGIAREFGPALGVSTADFNGDGWIDIYVANDGKENLLWLNQRNGTFMNGALLAGVALPVSARAEGSMGVDAGDFDNDGDEDLVMTELTSEGSNLYVNDGRGLFTDASASSMLGPWSLAFTGFGTGWVDFDNDGRLDLLAVNGTVQIIEAQRQARDPFPMHQKKLLLRNIGGRFEDVSARAGRAFTMSEVGRGVAFGDIDNDGDVDVLINNNNGHVRMLVNEAARGRHWLGLRLLTQRRDALGARVEVVKKSGGSIWRRARADGSYASASDPRVLAGLDDSAEALRVRVIWPGGRTESWPDVPIDRYTTLTEGTGR